MRVLVTGAGGFVGRHLIRALERRQHQVLAGVHRAGDSLHSQSSICVFDVMDQASMQRTLEAFQPDGIIHLAGQTQIQRGWDLPELMIQHNVIGTIRLLEAVKAAVPKAKVLTVGSSEEYGRTGQSGIPLTEDSLCSPQNPYAVSKYAAGQIGQQMARKQHLRVLHVRPFNHFGPGQQLGFVMSDFISQLAAIEAGKQEAMMKVGDLHVWRDFLYVEDVVNAYITLLEHQDTEEGIYNVCSGSPHQIKDILSLLIEMMQSSTSVQIVRNYSRPSDVPKFIGCADKLQRVTGWRTTVSLEEGLARTWQWWRSLQGKEGESCT